MSVELLLFLSQFLFQILQALQNDERARSFENQLLTYQDSHSHSNSEVSHNVSYTRAFFPYTQHAFV